MIEKKNVPFEIKEFGEEGEYFTFEGYASTFGNVDYGNDRIMEGAFSKTLRESKKIAPIINDSEGKPTGYKNILPSFWQHDTDEPVAAIVDIKEDDKGLPIKGIMPKTDKFVNDRVMPQMLLKNIKKLSIGYSTKGFEIVTEKIKGAETRIRNLKEIKLFEISLVSFPMNDGATITSVKASTSYENLPLAPRDTVWSKREAENRVREWAGATETPNARYRRAFFYYKSENPELFGSYKFPFADVINGRLVAVPAAIFNGAGRLKNSNIPEADKEKIQRHMEKYYDKMDRPSPFKSNTDVFKIDNFMALDERTCENLFQEGIKVNQKNAKMIVRILKENDQLFREEADLVREEQVKFNEIVQSLVKINKNKQINGDS